MFSIQGFKRGGYAEGRSPDRAKRDAPAARRERQRPTKREGNPEAKPPRSEAESKQTKRNIKY